MGKVMKKIRCALLHWDCFTWQGFYGGTRRTCKKCQCTADFFWSDLY